MHYVTKDNFGKFATKHMGISSNTLNHAVSYYTPNVLEKSTENMTMLSVFDKLAQERILFLSNEVNSTMSSIVSAQLLYMDTLKDTDITLYIDSPGGCVKSGLVILDTRNLLNSDVRTVCMGNGASMGSVLTGMGTKGKRSILPHAKIMLHQASGGFSGNVQDAEITMKQLKQYNDILFELLGSFCGKTASKVKKDAERDLWLMGQAAVDYGIVDMVLTKK